MKAPIRIVFKLIVVLTLMAACCVVLVFTSICKNQLVQQTFSPSGWYKLVVLETNCGATVDYVTNIVLLDGYAPLLPGQKGNVGRAEGHPRLYDIVIEWQDDRHVTITHNGTWNPLMQKEKVRGVYVNYVDASADSASPPIDLGE